MKYIAVVFALTAIVAFCRRKPLLMLISIGVYSYLIKNIVLIAWGDWTSIQKGLALLSIPFFILPLLAAVYERPTTREKIEKEEAEKLEMIAKNEQAAQRERAVEGEKKLAAEREKVRKTAEKAAQRKELSAINRIISKHIRELSIRRQQLIHKDQYGIEHKEKWEDEIIYFIEKVIHKEMEVIALSTQDQIKEAIDTKAQQYKDPKKSDISLDKISPIEYERQCSTILNKNGWSSRVTVASGDHGADIIAEKNGVVIAIQCKKYTGNVGNKAVQEIYSAKGFYNAQKAIVVSNAAYTRAARQAATKLEVFLIHHNDLHRLDKILEI